MKVVHDSLHIDGRIACSDELPMRVTALEARPGEGKLERINTSNLVLLRALVATDTLPAGGDDGERQNDDLQRLDARVGLLLHLVAQLVEQQQSMPAEHTLVFNARGLRVWLPEAIDEASTVRVELYLSVLYPTPLKLFGTVDDCVPEDGEVCHTIIFRDMSMAMRTELEKLVFRRHRRQIARERGQA